MLMTRTGQRPARTKPKAKESTMPKQSKKLQAGTTADVALDKVVVSPHNPRSRLDGDEIARLGESLEREGLLQRPLVRPRGNGELELIAGRRRYEAAKAKGYKTLPVTIVDADDRAAIVITVQENLQRKDLSPLEEARALELLVDNAGMRPEDVGKFIGMSQEFVRSTIRLLRLPEHWKQRLRDGEIKKSFASALTPYIEHPQVLAAIEASWRHDPEGWQGGGRDVVREKIKPIAEGVLGFTPTKGRRTKVTRQQVAAVQGTAKTQKSIAKEFGVSLAAVEDWKQQGAPIAGRDGETDLREVADWLAERNEKTAAQTSTKAPTRRAAPVKGFDTKEVRDRPKLLTERQAFDLLQPYADSRGDLQLIITHARSLLATLKD